MIQPPLLLGSAGGIPQQQQGGGGRKTTATIECPKSKVGRVIGKNGDTIKALQNYTGSLIQVNQVDDPCQITISGTQQSLNLAVSMVADIIRGQFKGFALLRQLAGPASSPHLQQPRPIYAPGYGLIPSAQFFGGESGDMPMGAALPGAGMVDPAALLAGWGMAGPQVPPLTALASAPQHYGNGTVGHPMAGYGVAPALALPGIHVAPPNMTIPIMASVPGGQTADPYGLAAYYTAQQLQKQLQLQQQQARGIPGDHLLPVVYHSPEAAAAAVAAVGMYPTPLLAVAAEQERARLTAAAVAAAAAAAAAAAVANGVGAGVSGSSTSAARLIQVASGLPTPTHGLTVPGWLPPALAAAAAAGGGGREAPIVAVGGQPAIALGPGGGVFVDERTAAAMSVTTAAELTSAPTPLAISANQLDTDQLSEESKAALLSAAAAGSLLMDADGNYYFNGAQLAPVQ